MISLLHGFCANRLRLSEICNLLGYGTKYVTESTERLCEQYHNLRTSDSIIQQPTTKGRKLPSNNTLSAKKRKGLSNRVKRRTTGTSDVPAEQTPSRKRQRQGPTWDFTLKRPRRSTAAEDVPQGKVFPTLVKERIAGTPPLPTPPHLHLTEMLLRAAQSLGKNLV